MVSVVLFSGGRGSDVLSRQLIGHPDVALTIAINGYDDGASTGEVRRFLGDSLGPSDFRKNASRVARETRSCPDGIIEMLDTRLPSSCSREDALQALDGVAIAGGPQMRQRVDAVCRELETGRPFEFSDCAIGNLVFAGSYLLRGRRFNDAVDDYCALLGLPPGLIDNVTDGTNAFLVALERDRGVLVSEAEIVDAKQQNRISDVFLIDRPLSEDDRTALARLSKEECATWLDDRSRTMPLNPRLRASLAAADLIIYAPGTQHSSLFPSYLTKDLSRAIASNLTAIKLLVTNIQADAEISGSTAVDIVERAVYYLKEKGKLPLPVPTLITHYIINDPRVPETDVPGAYVPLGRLDTLRALRLTHHISLPLLRKDFILSPAQIYETRAAGADAVLLIAAALPDDAELADLHALALDLGLTPLMEVHTLSELERILRLPRLKLVGVNNRDLTTFNVSLETTAQLRPHVPAGIGVVSESGIFTAEHIARLAALGVNAALVGEALVTAADIGAKVRELALGLQARPSASLPTR